jgi:hypothetical protein
MVEWHMVEEGHMVEEHMVEWHTVGIRWWGIWRRSAW